MTRSPELEKVLNAVHAELGDPSTWGAPVEMRGSLALCALNSAYSLRSTSASVRNVLRHYRQHRAQAGADPEADSGPDLLEAMDAAGGPRSFSIDVLATRAAFPKTGRLRAEAVYDALTNLAARDITTAEQLLAHAEDEEAERAWRSVKGLGGLSWAYLLMNAGDEDRTKSDTMLTRFLGRATGAPVNPGEAERLATAAANVLGVKVRALDRAIWLHESPDRDTNEGTP